MTAKRTPKKTIAQQRAVTAERTPQVALAKCGAVRVGMNGPHTCTLDAGHDDAHSDGTRSWRRSSGDEQA